VREPSTDHETVGTGPAVALNMKERMPTRPFRDTGSIEAIVGHEHDDDLSSTVDTRHDVETDDFPASSDDFDAQEQDQEGTDGNDTADESIVGK
jgi:hypothetical protein